jgi:hypothetical protein
MRSYGYGLENSWKNEGVMETQNSKFEGWAVVELFGHQKEFGFVTTQYFGGSAMFQIDVPELAEREVTLRAPGYVESSWTPAGTVVKRSAVPARSRLVGPSAVYSLNPCEEAVVRRMIDESSRAIAVVSLPDSKQLESGATERDDDDDMEGYDASDSDGEDR